MKDKSYTILELQRLYAIFLCDKLTEGYVGEFIDILYAEDNHFIPKKFLIWLRKREASIPDFKDNKEK